MRIVAPSIVALFVALAAPAFATDAAAPGPLGYECSSDFNCQSNHCVDGVCCSTACDGVCQACSAEKKQSGKDSGTCGPVRGGTDPDDECTASTPDTCGLTGMCSGAAAQCARYALGTPCDSGSVTQCQNGSFLGRACDGQGTCSVNPYTSPTSCGDYVCRPDTPGTCSSAPCNGHCVSPCATNADCSDTAKVCLGGACVSKRGSGAVCTVDADCTSGHCADGVCCNTSCPGACESCVQAGKEGTCSPLPSGSGPAHGVCSGTGPCAGACTGQRDCAYPGAAAECAPAACDADSVVGARHCDGTGECAAATTTNCGEYTCNPGSRECNATCTTSADCKGGGTCLTATHACTTAGATCDGDYAVKATDGTVTSCNGYRCTAGACQGSCASDLDCAPGNACRTQRCVAVTDAGTVPSGNGGAGGAANPGAGGTPGMGGTSAKPDSGTPPTGAQSASSNDSGGCSVAQRREANGRGYGVALLTLGLMAGRRRRSRARAASER